ncbi:hypothetical protein R3I93_009607 [Phoxinus phoxinus]|uniref:Uncharacterized protein n=1 Tax=Phoxinus phoxinus TaxID=58324 RepID=A0AAN9CY64_9TELE
MCQSPDPSICFCGRRLRIRRLVERYKSVRQRHWTRAEARHRRREVKRTSRRARNSSTVSERNGRPSTGREERATKVQAEDHSHLQEQGS